MKELKQIAKENKFQYRPVTAEEREDGIGAVVGDNWVKDEIWYTTAEMMEEIGLSELQVKSADLDPSVGLDKARQSAIDWLKKQGATWYSVVRCRYTFNNTRITVTVHYGK